MQCDVTYGSLQRAIGFHFDLRGFFTLIISQILRCREAEHFGCKSCLVDRELHLCDCLISGHIAHFECEFMRRPGQTAIISVRQFACPLRGRIGINILAVFTHDVGGNARKCVCQCEGGGSRCDRVRIGDRRYDGGGVVEREGVRGNRLQLLHIPFQRIGISTIFRNTISITCHPICYKHISFRCSQFNRVIATISQTIPAVAFYNSRQRGFNFLCGYYLDCGRHLCIFIVLVILIRCRHFICARFCRAGCLSWISVTDRNSLIHHLFILNSQYDRSRQFYFLACDIRRLGVPCALLRDLCLHYIECPIFIGNICCLFVVATFRHRYLHLIVADIDNFIYKISILSIILQCDVTYGFTLQRAIGFHFDLRGFLFLIISKILRSYEAEHVSYKGCLVDRELRFC